MEKYSNMFRITENDIRNMVKKAILEAVDKLNVRQNGISRKDVMDGITLYHRPKDGTVTIGGKKMSIIDSVFTYGFSREFTNSNGGNLYGAGVYSVYNLKSSTDKANGYGNAILMLKLLGGYQDFLLLSMQKAKEVYGNNWKPADQIRYLYPDFADKIFSDVNAFLMNDEDNPSAPLAFDKDGNELDNSREQYGYRSADTMYQITSLLGKSANNGKCRGWVYNGGHDGDCCVIMDFQSVVPVAVSYDDGQTWEDKLSDELIGRLNTEVDTKFQYGNSYNDVADKSINGYTIVYDNDQKVNYIPSNSNKPISDIWFDEGFNWNMENGTLYANVVYQGYDLYLVNENGDYQIYSTDWEPICSLEELPSVAEQ